jgi:biopolymer transport protein ExbD
LPQAEAQVLPQDVKTITLSFNADGKLFWDTEQVLNDDLDQRFTLSAKLKPQPEILLRADKSTRFEFIAQVMSAAQSHGLNKIGFATESKSASASAKSSQSLTSNPLKK